MKALVHQARRYCGPAQADVVRLRGAASRSAADLEMLYVGNGANLPFVRALLFAESSADPVASFANALAARKAIGRLEAAPDLIVIDFAPLWGRLVRLPCDIRSPAWIIQVLELPDASGDGTILPRPLEREVQRHVRRERYTVDFTSEEADLRAFFHDLYLGYAAARFRERAIVVTEQYFMARTCGHGLARLWCGGVIAAAMTFEHKRGALHLGWYAARADPAPRGASEVLDAFCIRRAWTNGIRRVVMGKSRPALIDGVLRYKTRFGARIAATRFPEQQIGIQVMRWSERLVPCLDGAQLIGFAHGEAVRYRVRAAGGRYLVEVESIASPRAGRRSPRGPTL